MAAAWGAGCSGVPGYAALHASPRTPPRAASPYSSPARARRPDDVLNAGGGRASLEPQVRRVGVGGRRAAFCCAHARLAAPARAYA
jgi:hypothetical protein